jgi:hypothetical protein
MAWSFQDLKVQYFQVGGAEPREWLYLILFWVVSVSYLPQGLELLWDGVIFFHPGSPGASGAYMEYQCAHSMEPLLGAGDTQMTQT